MNQILFAILIGITCCTGCTDNATTAGGSDKQQTNLEAARKVAKAFETGDVSAIDSVVADDFVDHTDRGDKVGRDSLKAMVNMIRTNFKDMKMETIRELADDEYTFQWMHYTGTSDGSMGMAAGPFDMHGMEITKFRDGKAVEHWAYMDVAEMMKMMGQQGAPPPPPIDTTKGK
jgi:predicted SnoaL-like aldol condensation-catalyzing enzyme